MNKLVLAAALAAACHAPCGARAPAEVAQPLKLEETRTVPRRKIIVDDVARLTWAGGAKATFAPTTLVEREVVADLVPKLLAGAAASPAPDLGQWQPAAARAGLRLEIWELGGQIIWALVEPPERRRGAGAYLFRAGAGEGDETPAILLQAPHADYDIGTGDIAVSLFVDPPPGRRPRALFLSTIHRYQVEPGRRQRRADNPADVAHNPDHLFNVATDAAARALGDVVVLQLHGFADASDVAEDAAVPSGTEMVISAGDRRGSSPLVSSLAAGLRQAFGAGVRRFPEEIEVLGATTNVQGRALAGTLGARFVHLEISAGLRKELRASPAKLTELGRILFRGR